MINEQIIQKAREYTWLRGFNEWNLQTDFFPFLSEKRSLL